MSDPRSEPVGVVLAGGRGRRLGGDKAVAELGGRPLIAHPLAAMRAVLAEVAVVAKRDTALPEGLDGVAVWIEPDEPRHPLLGIVHALRCARGRAVLVCAADLPFVTAGALRALVAADAAGAPAVLVEGPDGTQPLLGRYEPGAAALLEPAARAGTASVRAVVAALGPRLLTLKDPGVLFNVNSPEDLRIAEDRLRGRVGDH
jgi:molybdopterin-guanine dinucleotide biosynthesis protein A